MLPIAAILSLATVDFGGWALLGFITGGEQLGPFRERFLRAGQAHAGVLLVRSLVYFLYLPRAAFSNGLEWLPMWRAPYGMSRAGVAAVQPQ